MNSLIINIPPRTVRPATRSPLTFNRAAMLSNSGGGSGGDDLQQLARDIVKHDPVLAMLLARSGDRLRQQ